MFLHDLSAFDNKIIIVSLCFSKIIQSQQTTKVLQKFSWLRDHANKETLNIGKQAYNIFYHWIIE